MLIWVGSWKLISTELHGHRRKIFKVGDSIRFIASKNEGPDSTASAEAEGNALCQTQNPLHSPHKGFWTLVLKLLDQYTEAMTGRPALQQSC